MQKTKIDLAMDGKLDTQEPLKCDAVEPMLYSRNTQIHRQVRS